MESYETIVKEIAEESPITSENEINFCKHCLKSWAEDNFDKYLEREKEIDAAPMESGTSLVGKRWERKPFKLTWDHHDKDCLWVKANLLIQRKEVR